MTGFLVKGGAPNGKDAHFARLAGTAQMRDGSLLVTDDTNNIIYRVSYNQNQTPPIMARDDISMNAAGNGKRARDESRSVVGFYRIWECWRTNIRRIFRTRRREFHGRACRTNAKSLVLMMEDPDAMLKPVTHWIVANISPNVTSFPENVPKTEKYGDAVQGANLNGKNGLLWTDAAARRQTARLSFSDFRARYDAESAERI